MNCNWPNRPSSHRQVRAWMRSLFKMSASPGWHETIAPDLEIHGSTQMSITSAEGAELAQSFGCSRVVLGRELSLADIRTIAKQSDVELEVFVHGRLCVSYSGQCFSSEAWGGRSANRGKCAQACRLSYDLIVDGRQRDLGPYRYLLSPGDLYALEQIPELVDIGVACLKIEGRYKDSDYVALTTAPIGKRSTWPSLQLARRTGSRRTARDRTNLLPWPGSPFYCGNESSNCR